MDVISSTASIIAVIQLADRVLCLCGEYANDVKNARKDMERLDKEIKNTKNILEKVSDLLRGPDGTKLMASQSLEEAVTGYISELEGIEGKLRPGKRQKAMSRVGLRALNWPLQKNEIESVMGNLERYKQLVIGALQVDHITLTLDVNRNIQYVAQKIDLPKLPTAKGATFNSYMDQHEDECLPGTRTDLLFQVSEWSQDPKGKFIYWLSGMAGTGKSTISRTIAKSLSTKGRLGASFFFKRGEGDRGNATRFFPTIVSQLIKHIPGLKANVEKAIEMHPGFFEEPLKEQCEKLLVKPLSSIRPSGKEASQLVIVVDALDECDEEKDIGAILRLISQARDTISIHLRTFLTSRPELIIRLGFIRMPGDTHQDLVLHEIPRPVVEHDISVFIQHRLTEIRDQRMLSPDWPGNERIQTLVEMAIPLFIFAATICHFIADPRWSPEKRLAIILESRLANHSSKFDQTYLPILNQLLVDQDEIEKENIAREFREIVGAIIMLEDPLSTVSLARLLDIPRDDIDCRLHLLHSVLSIPDDKNLPVRILHLSFRDFLLDTQKRGKSPFWIDSTAIHKTLFSKCLQLLSGCLQEDICSLQRPGMPRTEIESQKIDECLPAETQYACRYWVHHLQQSSYAIHDMDDVHVFLQCHLLHWLESLSILGKMAESISLITTLQSLVATDNPQVSAFLYDSKRFVLKNRGIIDQAPLQLYSSALVFAPENSIVRRTFRHKIPGWIRRMPKVESSWSPTLQTLEGHSGWVSAVTFSPDGKLLASGSRDCTIKLWDAATGSLQQTLEGHSGWVRAVAFSPDGKLIASGSHDSTIKIWDVTSGLLQQILKGHSDWVNTVVFSLDGKLIASGSEDRTIKIWDAANSLIQQIFKGHSDSVNTVAFSSDNKLVISASDDRTIKVWDITTSSLQQTFEGHSDSVTTVIFSPDGKLIASGSHDMTVKLWDATNGLLQQTLRGHSASVSTVIFSPDGRQVISGSYDRNIKLWDITTGLPQQTLKGHSGWVSVVVFSPDGKLVASGSVDGTIKLWDITSSDQQMLKGHSSWVSVVAFSPDNKVVASGSEDGTVKLWDTATGSLRQTLNHSGLVRVVTFSPDNKLVTSGSGDFTIIFWDITTGLVQQTLKSHYDLVSTIAFSPDNKLVASGSADCTTKLWDTATGSLQQTLIGHFGWVQGHSHSDSVSTVVFSPDSKLVASGSHDRTIKIWDTSGLLQQTLEGHSDWVNIIRFSLDGKLLISGSHDRTVKLWDITTGLLQQTFKGHSDWVKAIAFSPDNKLLASGSHDRTINLWDAASGSLQQTFEVEAWITELSFSKDGPYLQTDRGRVNIQAWYTAPSSIEPRIPYDIFVKNTWVTRDMVNTFWLPSDYRATCSHVWDNVVVLGHASGRVSFLEFSF